MFCVGCGENVTNRVNDRRNLETESSKAVLALLKDIFMLKLDDEGVVDTEGFVQSVIESNRMCRRCFSAFDRLKKLKKTVEVNANDNYRAFCFKKKCQMPLGG